MTRMNRIGFPTGIARDMDRLVHSVLGADASPLLAALPSLPTRAFPGVNVWEDADSVQVEAELPGFSMDQIDVTMTGTDLTISGERPEPSVPEGAAFHRRERPVGRFTRVIHLGVPINGEGVSASMSSGVLTVTLPKSDAAKPRKIQVKSK